VIVGKNSSDSSSAVPSPSVIRQRHAAPDVVVIAATVANAICDALDIEHIELPATPERVWRAIRGKMNARE